MRQVFFVPILGFFLTLPCHGQFQESSEEFPELDEDTPDASGQEDLEVSREMGNTESPILGEYESLQPDINGVPLDSSAAETSSSGPSADDSQPARPASIPKHTPPIPPHPNQISSPLWHHRSPPLPSVDFNDTSSSTSSKAAVTDAAPLVGSQAEVPGGSTQDDNPSLSPPRVQPLLNRLEIEELSYSEIQRILTQFNVHPKPPVYVKTQEILGTSGQGDALLLIFEITTEDALILEKEARKRIARALTAKGFRFHHMSPFAPLLPPTNPDLVRTVENLSMKNQPDTRPLVIIATPLKQKYNKKPTRPAFGSFILGIINHKTLDTQGIDARLMIKKLVYRFSSSLKKSNQNVKLTVFMAILSSIFLLYYVFSKKNSQPLLVSAPSTPPLPWDLTPSSAPLGPTPQQAHDDAEGHLPVLHQQPPQQSARREKKDQTLFASYDGAALNTEAPKGPTSRDFYILPRLRAFTNPLPETSASQGVLPAVGLPSSLRGSHRVRFEKKTREHPVSTFKGVRSADTTTNERRIPSKLHDAH